MCDFLCAILISIRGCPAITSRTCSRTQLHSPFVEVACNFKHLLAGLLTLSVPQGIPGAFSNTCYLHILKARQFFRAERQRSQYLWPFHASLSLTPLCRSRSPLPLPKCPAPVTVSLPGLGCSQLCQISWREKQLGFNKLNFAPDRQGVYIWKSRELFSKFFMNIDFHLRALVGRGRSRAGGSSRSAICRTNPAFPSSSSPGHFMPAGAQFAPVSEGAGEPCSWQG